MAGATLISPLTIGQPLPQAQFHDIRLSMIFDYHKWDPQYEDVSTLACFPLILESAAWNELRVQAERLWREAIAAEREAIRRPELLKKIGLGSPVTKALNHIAQQEPSRAMARMMRFDFHLTIEGWRISEANADVPGGFIESCEFTRLVSMCYPGTVAPGDVAAAYADAILRELEPRSQIALVHATAFTDDRQVMLFLADKFSSRGLNSILVSPADLFWVDGRAKVAGCDKPLDGLVRFFPAEWLPNISHRHRWERFFYGSRTPISNPAYALIVQSKRFPLIWDQLRTPVPTWRHLLPETHDPRHVAWQTNEEWVLKPSLGRVGELIGIRGVTAEKEWRQITHDVRRHPQRWVAQRRFSPLAMSAGDETMYACIGVFVIDGKACGIYGRIAKAILIDARANDVAVVIGQTANRENNDVGNPHRISASKGLTI